MRGRLLVVAKDTELRARLARRLSRMGHRVELAESIPHARRVISEKQFCLAILSLDGVGPEGFDFADELRSVVGETLLIGTGSNFGTRKHDDLIDPSDDDSLMARVNHAVLLQHDPDPPRQPPIRFAGYTLDLDGAALIDERGREIVLTRGEFALLREFIRGAGRVLSREHLRAALTGRDTEPYERSMDMLVVRLRRKIERDPKNPSLIITVPGQGYKFAVKPRVSVVPEETPVVSASNSAGVGRPIGVHIGIAGGQVGASRTGSAGHSEYNVTGDTVNLPSRLTAAAEADEILTSDGTRRVLAERFDRADTGTLPDKPSVVVLPFQNISGDPEQEYFADGMVEEITAALSRVRDFFVVARNSAFSYKGRAIPAQQISRDLGVRYLIEGSVRKAGNRVRITAQLIDGPSGNHLWADRYEGPLTDVFDLQDRITESVAGAIQPSVRSAEIERSRRKHPENLDAYDLVLRAYPSVWSLERAANAEALKLLDQAIAIEPDYQLALSLAAWCHAQQSVYNWTADLDRARSETLRLAQAAAALGGEDPTVLTVLGAAHTIVRNYEIAARMLEKALTLDPNSAWAWNRSGWLESYLDRADTAIEHFERALRLSPFDPMNFNAFIGIGGAHFVAGRYAEAALWFEKGLLENPGATWVYRNLVPAYALLGRDEDARAGLSRLLQEYPDLTISKVMSALVFSQSTLDRMAEG
jgi:TolB-like protein/DNA-binding response OmpR family regulator/tetratricopeptide (TPR) repeat protein